jgi:hypothetical protein
MGKLKITKEDLVNLIKEEINSFNDQYQFEDNLINAIYDKLFDATSEIEFKELDGVDINPELDGNKITFVINGITYLLELRAVHSANPI